MLGAGDPATEQALRTVAASFPDTVDLVIGFDESLAHLIQAASDILLMPSQYEPCGLAQLYAFRYGTIPVVRATGGLVDTVVDTTDDSLADGTASGFVFGPFSSAALEEAVRRAIALRGEPERWQRLVRRVMGQDWSWEASGRRYLELYQQTRAAPPVAVADVD
jgi:Glycogen synthase